jgi:hypothetical protein
VCSGALWASWDEPLCLGALALGLHRKSAAGVRQGQEGRCSAVGAESAAVRSARSAAAPDTVDRGAAPERLRPLSRNWRRGGPPRGPRRRGRPGVGIAQRGVDAGLLLIGGACRTTSDALLA